MSEVVVRDIKELMYYELDPILLKINAFRTDEMYKRDAPRTATSKRGCESVLRLSQKGKVYRTHVSTSRAMTRMQSKSVKCQETNNPRI